MYAASCEILSGPSITQLLLGVVGAIAAWRATQTHNEVKTLNAKTVGVLAGEQETRRIAEKPLEERTADDQRHLLDVPPEIPSSIPAARAVDIRDIPIQPPGE